MRITASFGVAGVGPGTTAAALVDAADEALYRAKRAARIASIGAATGHTDVIPVSNPPRAGGILPDLRYTPAFVRLRVPYHGDPYARRDTFGFRPA